MRLIFIPLLFLGYLGWPGHIFAQSAGVKSPDEQLQVNVYLDNGKAFYEVLLNNNVILEKSPLGLETNLVDFASNFTWVDTQAETVEKSYNMQKGKFSSITYHANLLKVLLQNKDEKKLNIIFQVSNHNIGLRYELPESGDPLALVVEKELTGFNFPQQSKGYLTHQSESMVGFKRTKPSYEEGYHVAQAIDSRSPHGLGYTFPGLFQVDENWVLLSETGVRGLYCGSKLSDPTPDGLYTIAFPDMTENNGFGSTGAAIGLPAVTPWRTITVGSTLKPIVETTIQYDLVDPLYEPSMDYEFGKGTWSWIMWQDGSMNYEDQMTYIDLATTLGYEYILIDAWWDRNIGYDRMEELIAYADTKDVDVFLWYNSNGAWSDAHMTPKNKMNTAIARKKEMKWMQENGVKGIKVDFFGGDKQETMRLYEDIMSDANDYGLITVFHGTTMPRGWARMFPNYGGSEAVLASENLMFSQGFNDIEALNASLHPFIRNASGVMEYGGVVLNERYNRTNDGGNFRRTSDSFQLAISVLFQNPIQFFALTPNNLQDAPDFAIDFMKRVPTTWDETVFMDGFPGKYCVLARRNGDRWYVAGVSNLDEETELELDLPMLKGQTVNLYSDDSELNSTMKKIKVRNNGKVKVKLQPNGGILIESETR